MMFNRGMPASCKPFLRIFISLSLLLPSIPSAFANSRGSKSSRKGQGDNYVSPNVFIVGGISLGTGRSIYNDLEKSENNRIDFDASLGLGHTSGFSVETFVNFADMGGSPRGTSIEYSQRDLIFGLKIDQEILPGFYVGGLFGPVKRQTDVFKAKTKGESVAAISGWTKGYGGEVIWQISKPIGIQLQFIRVESLDRDKVIEGQNVSFRVPRSNEFNVLWRYEGFEYVGGAQAGGSAAGAILLFVGSAFVTAVPVFYSLKYLLESFSIIGDKGWVRTSLSSTFVYNESKDSGGSVVSRSRGTMSGLRVSTGAENQLLGFSFEGGYFDINFQQSFVGVFGDKTGAYGMIGPRLNSKNGNLYLEVLGGTTSNDAIPVIAEARTGFQIPLGDNLEVGFDIGTIYFSLQQDEFFQARNISNFNYAGGVNMGFKF